MCGNWPSWGKIVQFPQSANVCPSDEPPLAAPGAILNGREGRATLSGDGFNGEWNPRRE